MQIVTPQRTKATSLSTGSKMRFWQLGPQLCLWRTLEEEVSCYRGRNSRFIVAQHPLQISLLPLERLLQDQRCLDFVTSCLNLRKGVRFSRTGYESTQRPWIWTIRLRFQTIHLEEHIKIGWIGVGSIRYTRACACYHPFLHVHSIEHPCLFPQIHYIADPELAYIMQRYH